MALHRLAITAFTMLALVIISMRTYADEDAMSGKAMAWANKLGLSEQQREQIRTIRAEYDKQLDPLEEHLWKLYHESRDAMNSLLTEEQREKLPTIIKAEFQKECQKIEAKLNLSEEQKQKVEKIREEYEPKFREVCAQSTDEARKKVHELKAEFFSAVRKELTDEQQAKFGGVLHQEFRHWRDPVARQERLNEIANQLGVTGNEKARLEKVRAEYQPKIDELSARVKEIHQNERAAVEKVLTDEQRTKVQEMWKMPELSR